jgi:hypothetical protein
MVQGKKGSSNRARPAKRHKRDDSDPENVLENPNGPLAKIALKVCHVDAVSPLSIAKRHGRMYFPIQQLSVALLRNRKLNWPR